MISGAQCALPGLFSLELSEVNPQSSTPATLSIPSKDVWSTKSQELRIFSQEILIFIAEMKNED